MAIMSMVPSLSPSISICLSFSVLNGGFILARVPCFNTASSVRVKWWGVTSAHTFAPSFLARRTISTECPELICWMSTVAPVSRAIMQSLATRESSARAGEP